MVQSWRAKKLESRLIQSDIPQAEADCDHLIEELAGWIDDVHGGIVYGRLADDRTAFEVQLLDVLEEQRVDLEPGSYCSFVNGHLLIERSIWTTHDMETADAEGQDIFAAIRWR